MICTISKFLWLEDNLKIRLVSLVIFRHLTEEMFHIKTLSGIFSYVNHSCSVPFLLNESNVSEMYNYVCEVCS